MTETGNKTITTDEGSTNESSANEGPGRVRASDRERERVASILRAAAAEGLLTMAEVDERLASAYAARYRDELGPLTADLPDSGRRLYADSPEGAAQRAEFRAWARARLIRHGAVVGLLAAVAITAWALSGADHFFPAPILFFGVLSLVLHARRLSWSGRGWAHPGWAHPGWSGPGWSGPGWSGPGWSGPGWSGPGWSGPAPERPERRPER